jgi:uncharacterized sporulation protein YeaH/YhbH (DUF444 family)
MTASYKIIKYAFDDQQIEECWNMNYWDGGEDYPNPYINLDITFDSSAHGDGLGYMSADWAGHLAEKTNTTIEEVRKVMFNRVMLKKLYKKLNLKEVEWKIKHNRELLMAIKKRVTERRIALNKIKRNAIYNNGLGLKLAVREYSKDF